MPVRQATAEDVTHALTDKLICYFGSEEFAQIFKINKFLTTAYHPQSNGSNERMHHTLNEYMKLY